MEHRKDQHLRKHTVWNGVIPGKGATMLPAPMARECTDKSTGLDSGSMLTFEGPLPGYSCCLGLGYLSCEVGVTVSPFY